jgi:hypothetical protein
MGRRGVFRLNLTLELKNNNSSTFYPFVLEQNSQQINFDPPKPFQNTLFINKLF